VSIEVNHNHEKARQNIATSFIDQLLFNQALIPGTKGDKVVFSLETS
jgi:hypothetical protein